jgi:hypothetical protein
MPSTSVDQLNTKLAFLMDYRRLLLASREDKAAEIEANNSKIRALTTRIQRAKNTERLNHVRQTRVNASTP